MELRTVLNRVHKLAGFVYGDCRLLRCENGDSYLEIDVRPRTGSRAVRSGCGLPAPGCDRLAARRFRFVPLLGLPGFPVYAMRRGDCPRCAKVKVERVPRADGKRRSTEAFARRLSWQDTARVFGASRDTVHRAVAMAVARGRERASLDGVTAIGVDEIAWQAGHRYLTLV